MSGRKPREKRPASGLARKKNSTSMDIFPLIGRFLVAVFLSGAGYLFSVNQNAGQGYEIRTLENQIAHLKDQNAELKIAEADLRSLYRIEASGEQLEMQKMEEVKYLEEPGPVAFK